MVCAYLGAAGFQQPENPGAGRDFRSRVIHLRIELLDRVFEMLTPFRAFAVVAFRRLAHGAELTLDCGPKADKTGKPLNLFIELPPTGGEQSRCDSTHCSFLIAFGRFVL